MIGHVAIRIDEIHSVRIERCTERAPGITRSRGDEHALESRFGQDPRVGDDVERYAAAKTQIRQAGLLMERTCDVDQRVLEHPLDAGGAIGEATPFGGFEVDRLVRAARRSEQIDESRRIRSPGRRVVLEVIEIEGERAIRCAADHLTHLIGQRRPPVRGKPHDLVLVLVHREAEIGRERRIEHAE